MTIATKVARRPMASETRPAIIVRVSRSRPLASVPNRKRWRSIGTSIDEPPAVVGALDHPGRAEQVGAIEIGEQPLVDRARRQRASGAGVAFDPGIFGAWRGCARAMRSDRRHDLLGLRDRRRQARRDAHIVLVDPIVGCPVKNGPKRQASATRPSTTMLATAARLRIEARRARRPRASGRRRAWQFGGTIGAIGHGTPHS